MSTTITLDDAKRRQMELRGARDQLIDLLGFGETLPLQDPVVRDDRLTVPANEIGTVPIDPGQTDARYHLCDPDGQVVPTDSPVGSGAATYLATEVITEDVTYQVLAKKLLTERQATLCETASVKVGIDRHIPARILADPLDWTLDDPADDHPRIVDWGSPIEVEIDHAQEGVVYHLVDLNGVELVDEEGSQPFDVSDVELVTISEQDAVGLGVDQTIVLSVASVEEDVLVGIVATKTFDPSTGIEPLVWLLELTLPLAVRADPDVTATLEPIVDHGADAAITLSGSQSSVMYQLYAQPLDDRDFIYYIDLGPGQLIDDRPISTVAVEGEEDAFVVEPSWTLRWSTPAGYSAVGDPTPGTDGDGEVIFPSFSEDHLVIVQARKEHALDLDDPSAGTIASEIQARPLLLLLVRPQSEPELSLRVPIDEATGELAGTIEVEDGQPGVFYQLLHDDAPVGRAAYVHQLDEIGISPGEMNKGVGQLRVGLDLATARGQEWTGSRAIVKPPSPQVILEGTVTFGSTLSVRAKRARTRITADLAETASIPALPEIRFEEAVVTAGSVGRIQVIASLDGDRYEPFLDGVSVKQARWGNGGELVFLTAAVTETTTFEVHVTRPDDDGLAVTRIVPLTLTVSG